MKIPTSIKFTITKKHVPKALDDLEKVLRDNPHAFIKIFLCGTCNTFTTIVTVPTKQNFPNRCRKCRIKTKVK